MDLFDLSGKVAVVTGAASGIGRALALGLAAAGSRLALADLNAQGMEETAREGRALGVKVLPFQMDVTQEAQVEQTMGAAREAFGRIDILVNAAGMNLRGPALEMSLADFQRVLEVDLVGVFLCARAAGRAMVEQQSGSIINVSSIMGHVAGTGNCAYASAKGGVSQLTRALALEWAPYNVRVNAICPGYVRTPLTEPVRGDPARLAFVLDRTPLKRVAEPEEIVGAAIFLAADAASYVTGTSLFVDGGWMAW